MRLRWVFAGIALLAILAGTAMFLGSPESTLSPRADVAPSALYAAGFRDEQGATRSLGQFRDKLLVVNFWATWCAPCREEMPAFARVQSRWAGRNVQFVGLAQDDPAKVSRFARELAINYPLWTGGDEVGELSRRLGNHMGVLPFTVILDPQGRVVEQRVGPYTEALLEQQLAAHVGNFR
jgi:thiol-disulfide isomerase/thioredoxin